MTQNKYEMERYITYVHSCIDDQIVPMKIELFLEQEAKIIDDYDYDDGYYDNGNFSDDYDAWGDYEDFYSDF